MAEKVDREATYLNCLTSGGPIRAAIPMTLPDDESVFEAVWKALKPERANQVRLVIIRNTLQLEELWVSENLLGELEGETEVVGRLFPLTFMADGQINL